MIIYYTYHFGGGREESHRLLKLAFAGMTGSDAEADSLISEMITGNAGKPYIPGFDFFSISHSGSAWAVLFAGSECGLDIQYPRKAGIKGIAERFYTADDREAVRTSPETEESFFRIWTRREALVKALGRSVASAGLPSVMKDNVKAENTDFIIKDIRLPGAPDLYAAICIQAGYDEEILPGELQFRELIQD